MTRKRVSSDDLQSVIDADAAESRARAALKLLEEEHQARTALEQDKLRLEERLKQLVSAPATPADVKSMRPGMLHFRGKDWKIAVPFTLLLALAPYAWTVIQRVQGVLQQLQDLNKAVASYSKNEESQDARISACVTEVALVKNTVARQAGYLAGALPMAGVSVPGAEDGAIQVNIDREPDPIGMKKRVKVVTHTRIPAPSSDASQ